MPEFTGFSKSSIKFLESLKENNNREWFNENKAEYEALIREPALDFIATMNEPLHELTPHFIAEPKKVGGSMMRPYRDTRFAKDKTPYKTNIGIQFRHAGGKNVHAPGYYVHIEAEESFIGIGLWKPEPEQLFSIRQSISEKYDQWCLLSKTIKKHGYDFTGETLKRPPKLFDKEDPAIEEIKRKSFLIIKSFNNEELFSPDFVKYVAQEFEKSHEFMQFLCRAVKVSF